MTRPTERFPELSPTPRGHLALRFYEAVLALVGYARDRMEYRGEGAGPVVEAHPFLESYLRDVAAHVESGASWDGWRARFRTAVSRWERKVDARLPLRAIRSELGLGEAHVTALLLVGLVEEDPRFGDLFAAAHGRPDGRRPSLGLLYQVAGAAGTNGGEPWSFARPLVEAGLVQVLDPDQPRADWRLRVPVPLWSALAGDVGREPLPGCRFRPAESWEPVSEMVLDDAQRARVAEACALLAAGETRTLVVRGLPGRERLELIGAAARELGRGVLEAGGSADSALLGPLATLLGAVPTFRPDLAPGETFALPDLAGFRGPVAVVLGIDGGVVGRGAENAVSVLLPPEGEALRRRHWERCLQDADPSLHRALAETFTIGGRHIRRAAGLARTHAALEQRRVPDLADVRSAARAVNRERLDSLATRLEDGGGWDRLVVHESTAGELRHLERRCRHRERLIEAVGDGLPGGMNRGVRALFQGPSGTGKTLAARVLAKELGLDLYRVDLSTVVSKYIGETEKNLSRVLGRAEDLDVVLLLDEGDSLMGKRTEVRSSHDRWANMETNYLLQRLDTYTGIVVVTTNLPGSVDSAFQRRMDAVVRFHAPTVEERWHLWQQHLPPDHELDPEFLEATAVRYELTGGQIRNATVDATLLSLGAPGGRLRAEDLTTAVLAEYRKAGGSPPRAQPARQDDDGAALSAFLGAIR